MKDSNIGQVGVSSIRIDGLKIGNLPLGQGNDAKTGLVGFLKTDKETRVNNILAKYPKHKLEFLQSQIRECRRNIERMKDLKCQLREKISEYRKLIVDCMHGEQELMKCDDKTSIRAKELRLKYPAYDIDALDIQIKQFEDTIVNCDRVIEQDHESIVEIGKVLSLVEQRERELKNV